MRAEDKARRKGQGHIFKRGSMYYVRFSINGKRKTISLHTSNKEVAEKNAKTYLPVVNAETKEELAAHVAVARKLRKAKNILPVEDAWKEFEKHPGRNESSQATLDGYKRAWTIFVDYSNIKFVGEVDSDLAETFAQKLWKDKVSASTFNCYIGYLRVMFRLLLDTAGLEQNPFAEIKRKKLSPEKHQRISDDDFKKIIAVINAPQKHKCKVGDIDEVRVLIYLGAYTGLRLKDCCLAEKSSIDLKEQTIQIRTFKTGTIVKIPIAPMLLNVIKNFESSDKSSKYLLPGIAARYVKDKGSVSTSVKRVFKAAGLETTNSVDPKERQRQRNSNKYGFHSLRHTFISWCARAGVPLSIVQSIVGHFSQEMTQYYIHITDEERKVIINALPDI